MPCCGKVVIMSIFKNIREMLTFNVNSFFQQNKDEAIADLIIEMEEQIKRLELMIAQANSKESEALSNFLNSQTYSKTLEEKAKVALLADNEILAKETLSKKYFEDFNLKEKELIYTTLNAQASNLKEQLETLNFKLEEIIKFKKSLESSSKNLDNIKSIQSDMNFYGKNSISKNQDSKEIIDAEIERLMKEIKDAHNIN